MDCAAAVGCSVLCSLCIACVTATDVIVVIVSVRVDVDALLGDLC